MVAGPLYGEEGMLVHDCDLREGLHAKRVFDAVGHYSRDDVLGGFAELPREPTAEKDQGGDGAGRDQHRLHADLSD